MTAIHWTDAAEDTYLTILNSIYEKSTAAALCLDEQLEALLSRLRPLPAFRKNSRPTPLQDHA
jgi:plasmid stabilization system protein ParE